MTAHKFGFLLGRVTIVGCGTGLIARGLDLPLSATMGILLLAWIASPRYDD